MAKLSRKITMRLIWLKTSWKSLFVSFFLSLVAIVLWIEFVGLAPLVGDLTIDQNTMWSLHPSILSGVNEYGYRGHPIDLDAPKSGIRIAVVGDSATYGIGRFRPSTTFSGVLEQQLNEAGVPCEVANLGVPGFTIIQGLRRLSGFLEDGEFDFAIFRFAHNERQYSVTRLTDSNRQLAKLPFSNIRWVDRSRLIRSLQFVRARWKSIDGLGPSYVRRVPQGEFHKKVLESIRLCQAQGAEAIWCKYTVLNNDETLDDYNRTINEACVQAGVKFVEFPNLLAASSDAFLLNENHPNGLGHQIIGKTLSVAVLEMVAQRNTRPGGTAQIDSVVP